MTKQIPLTNSDKFALVDDDIFDKVMKYKWSLIKGGRVTDSRGFWPLSHYATGLMLDGTLRVTHKNKNKLDNRKDNLIIHFHKYKKLTKEQENMFLEFLEKPVIKKMFDKILASM